VGLGDSTLEACLGSDKISLKSSEEWGWGVGGRGIYNLEQGFLAWLC
jgi:hypothetical protein